MNQIPQSARAQALAAARAQLPIVAPVSNTISSVSLVEIINDLREPGRALLEHSDLLKKIEKVLKKDAGNFSGIYCDTYGREKPCYHLPRREASLIAMSESYEVQAKVYDRMESLERAAPGAPAANIPQSFADALRLAADQQDTIAAQVLLIAAQVLLIAAAAPAVAFVDRYVDSTGLKGFRQVCKLLGAKENAFRDFLIDEKIMYKLAGEWTPHAQHLDTGRFEVKAGTSEVSGHAFNSARWTPKGVSWIAGEWAKFNVRAA